MAQAILGAVVSSALSGNGDQAAATPGGPVSTPVGRPISPFESFGPFQPFLGGLAGQPLGGQGIGGMLGGALGQQIGQMNPIIPALLNITQPATRVAPPPPPTQGKN